MTGLGSFNFPEKRTFVRSRIREVLSKVRREIDIYSLLIGYGNLENLEQDLEILEGELEKFNRKEVTLSLHPGRYVSGWRRDYQRVIEPRHKAASLHLLILTDDRFERSIEEHQETLILSASGQSIEISQEGNGEAFPRLVLTATGTLIHPAISDGTRTLSFQGQLEPGMSLHLDSDFHTALINGSENVLQSLSGEFPLLDPGTTQITYTDHSSSTHSGTLEINYRDLWI